MTNEPTALRLEDHLSLANVVLGLGVIIPSALLLFALPYYSTSVFPSALLVFDASTTPDATWLRIAEGVINLFCLALATCVAFGTLAMLLTAAAEIGASVRRSIARLRNDPRPTSDVHELVSELIAKMEAGQLTKGDGFSQIVAAVSKQAAGSEE